MWVARDKNGCLHLFSVMPKRHSSCGLEYWKVDVPYSTITLDDKEYPELTWLTWEDEPVEVNLTLVKPFHFKLTEEAKQVVEKNTSYSTDEIRNMRIFKNPQVARIYNQFAYKDKQD